MSNAVLLIIANFSIYSCFLKIQVRAKIPKENSNIKRKLAVSWISTVHFQQIQLLNSKPEKSAIYKLKDWTCVPVKPKASYLVPLSGSTGDKLFLWQSDLIFLF